MDCSMDCFMDCLMDWIVMILHKIATCEHSFDNITIVIFQYQRNFSEWKWTAYVMDCFMDYMMDCYGLCCGLNYGLTYGLNSHFILRGGILAENSPYGWTAVHWMDCLMDCYGLYDGLLWTAWWTTMD